jgi:hypothetical protein
VLASGRRARAGNAGEALYIDRKHGFHITKKKIDKVPRYIVSPNASSIKIWACLEPHELRYIEDGAEKTIRLTPAIKIERIRKLRLPEKLPKPSELGLKDIAQAVEGYIELGEYLESEDFKKLLPEGVEYRAERGRIPIIIRFYRTRRRWKLKTGYDPEFQEPPEHEGEYERCHIEVGDAELVRELSKILSNGEKLRRLLRRYVHVAIIAMFMLRSQKGWWRILEYLPEKAVREFMGMSLDKKRGRRYWSGEARKIFYIRKVQYLASFVRYFVMEHRRVLGHLEPLVDASTSLRRRRTDPRKGIRDLLNEMMWIEERVKGENRDYRLAEALDKMREIIESYRIYVDDIENSYNKYLGEFNPIDYLKMFKPFNMLPLEEYVKDIMNEMENPYWYIYMYRGGRMRWAGSKIPDVSRARTLIYRRIWRHFSKIDNDKYIEMLVDAIVKHEIEFLRERELRAIKRENMRRYRIGAVVTKWDEMQLEKMLKKREKELREVIEDSLRKRMKPSRMRARAWIKYLYALASKIITHAFHPYINRYMYTPGEFTYDDEGNRIYRRPRKRWFFHVLGVDQYNIDMQTTEAFRVLKERSIPDFGIWRDGIFKAKYPTLRRFDECLSERTPKECLEEVNWEIRNIMPGDLSSLEEVPETWRMIRRMHALNPYFWRYNWIDAEIQMDRIMNMIQKMVEPPGIIMRHVPDPLWIDPGNPEYKEDFRKRFLNYIPLLTEERKADGMLMAPTTHANLGRFFKKYGRPPRDIPVRVFMVNPDFDWQKVFETAALLTMKIVEKAVEKGDLKLPDEETIKKAMEKARMTPFEEDILLGEIGKFLDEFDRYPPSGKPILRNLYAYVIGKALDKILEYRVASKAVGKDFRTRIITIYEPERKQAAREGYIMLEFDPRIGSKMSRRFRSFMFLETKIDALLGVSPFYFLLQHRNVYWDKTTRRARERLAYLAIKTKGAILGNYDFIGERHEFHRASSDEWEKKIDERVKRRIDAKIYATAREFVKAVHSKFLRLMNMPHKRLINLLKKYGDKSLEEIWFRRQLELELVRKGQKLEPDEVLQKIKNKEMADLRSIETLKKIHREILNEIKDSEERRKLRKELRKIEREMERKARLEMEREIEELSIGSLAHPTWEETSQRSRPRYETKADMLLEKQREAEEREKSEEQEERKQRKRRS